jgi:hypothetical protein
MLTLLQISDTETLQAARIHLAKVCMKEEQERHRDMYILLKSMLQSAETEYEAVQMRSSVFKNPVYEPRRNVNTVQAGDRFLQFVGSFLGIVSFFYLVSIIR